VDVLCQIPAEMNHGDNGLEVLDLIPLEPLHSELILSRREGAHVPSDVVTPANGLNPVDTARIDPNQITWALPETIDRNLLGVEVVQIRPPGTMEVAYTIPNKIIQAQIIKT